MDDTTLAPFVDALASALIIMVLAAVFFLLQSLTSLEQSAKLYTDSLGGLTEKGFNPISFHKPLKVDMEKNEILYMLNFNLEDGDLNAIKNEMLSSDEAITLTFYSNDTDTKITANILHFLGQLELPREIKVDIVFAKSESTISKVIWEF